METVRPSIAERKKPFLRDEIRKTARKVPLSHPLKTREIRPT
jgi:hypothetical protein